MFPYDVSERNGKKIIQWVDDYPTYAEIKAGIEKEFPGVPDNELKFRSFNISSCSCHHEYAIIIGRS